jgi:hypothetical protein
MIRQKFAFIGNFLDCDRQSLLPSEAVQRILDNNLSEECEPVDLLPLPSFWLDVRFRTEYQSSLRKHRNKLCIQSSDSSLKSFSKSVVFDT